MKRILTILLTIACIVNIQAQFFMYPSDTDTFRIRMRETGTFGVTLSEGTHPFIFNDTVMQFKQLLGQDYASNAGDVHHYYASKNTLDKGRGNEIRDELYMSYCELPGIHYTSQRDVAVSNCTIDTVVIKGAVRTSGSFSVRDCNYIELQDSVFHPFYVNGGLEEVNYKGWTNCFNILSSYDSTLQKISVNEVADTIIRIYLVGRYSKAAYDTIIANTNYLLKYLVQQFYVSEKTYDTLMLPQADDIEIYRIKNDSTVVILEADTVNNFYWRVNPQSPNTYYQFEIPQQTVIGDFELYNESYSFLINDTLDLSNIKITKRFDCGLRKKPGVNHIFKAPQFSQYDTLSELYLSLNKSYLDTGDTLDFTKVRAQSFWLHSFSDASEIDYPDSLDFGYDGTGLFNIYQVQPSNIDTLDFSGFTGDFQWRYWGRDNGTNQIDTVMFPSNDFILHDPYFAYLEKIKYIDYSDADSVYGTPFVYWSDSLREVIYPDTSKVDLSGFYITGCPKYFLNDTIDLRGMLKSTISYFIISAGKWKELYLDPVTHTGQFYLSNSKADTLNLSNMKLLGTSRHTISGHDSCKVFYKFDTLRCNSMSFTGMRVIDTIKLDYDYNPFNNGSDMYFYNCDSLKDFIVPPNGSLPQITYLNQIQTYGNETIDTVKLNYDWYTYVNNFYGYDCDSLKYVYLPDSTKGSIYLYNNPVLDYINFGGKTDGSVNLRIYDNNWDAAIVNRILVDLDNDSNVGTGMTIDISGTNAAPDASSGGYDGTTAVSSLVSKGVNLTTN